MELTRQASASFGAGPPGPPRLRPRRVALWLASLLLLGLLCADRAQAVTFLEQAERLQVINAFLLDLRPGQAPVPVTAPTLDLGVELLPPPSINPKGGSKEEPIDTPPVVPRVRVRFLWPWGLMLGATANPPVPVLGFTATWLGAEAGLRTALGPLHGELRLFTMQATVLGPITEREAQDEFRMANRGSDVRLGAVLGPVSAYAGVGRGSTDTELHVEADGALLTASQDYGYWLAGVSAELAGWLLTFEQNRTEDFLYHFLLGASLRF